MECTRKTVSRALVAGLAFAAASSLAHAEEKRPAGGLVDDAGKPIKKQDTRRIVSVGGALTEIIVRLGAGDRIVAVDTTSLYPPAVTKSKPNVGYLRRLSAEGVLSMKPTVIIAEGDAGPPTVLDKIRAAGGNLVLLRRDKSLSGIMYKIRAVAAILGKRAEGEAMVKTYRSDLAAIRQSLKDVRIAPKVLFVLSIGRGALLAAGSKTAAHTVIEAAGGRNAMQGFSLYKPISAEAMLAAKPDVILVMGRTLRMAGGRQKLLAHPALALTPAGRNGRLVSMDDLYLLGFGPRTPLALVDLAKALHPSLAVPRVGTTVN